MKANGTASGDGGLKVPGVHAEDAQSLMKRVVSMDQFHMTSPLAKKYVQKFTLLTN
jgi:hypothetical protein